jgi:hypothetical protein
MSRILTWVSPGGTRKTATIGGRRRHPVASPYTAAANSFEMFLERQRERVAQRLQHTVERISARRTDGMTQQQALKETTIKRRG